MKTARRSASPRKASAPVQTNPPTHAAPFMASRTHGLIIDAVAEILTHGGAPDDVTMLLCATMGHTRRRTFRNFDVSPTDLKTEVDKFLRDNIGEWRTDLAIGWRKNNRSEVPAVEATTIRDRIMANVRQQVLVYFRHFMDSASPEELWLLREVLCIWDSASLPPENRSRELFLGEAFQGALGSNSSYLEVPAHMVDQVQRYIDALVAVDTKAA